MDISSRNCISIVITIFLFVLHTTLKKKNNKNPVFSVEFCVMVWFLLVLCPFIRSLAVRSVAKIQSPLFSSLIHFLSPPHAFLSRNSHCPFLRASLIQQSPRIFGVYLVQREWVLLPNVRQRSVEWLCPLGCCSCYCHMVSLLNSDSATPIVFLCSHLPRLLLLSLPRGVAVGRLSCTARFLCPTLGLHLDGSLSPCFPAQSLGPKQNTESGDRALWSF